MRREGLMGGRGKVIIEVGTFGEPRHAS